MPHCLFKAFKNPSFPFSKEGYRFVCEVKKEDDLFESLILVHFEQYEFFLQKRYRKKNDDFILKYKRISKNLPTGIVKTAMKIFSSLNENQIIAHNLSNNSPRQSLISPFSKNIEDFLDFRECFELEIGFGSGRHLLNRAQNHPTMRFIGIELYTPSIEQVLRQIELKGLQNVWIVHCDARVFLELLPSSLARAIYLHFPVPWEKKPHRRVWSEKFLKESLRILQDGGMLELRSDDENYFLYALEIAMKQKQFQCRVSKNIQKEVISKYEDRWLRQKKDIYGLQVFALPCERQEREIFDFSFPKGLFVGSFDRIPKKSVGDGWFLHIDSLYSNDEISVLVLSFGDFNQPQSKFLLISSDGEAQYLGGSPIPTLSAFKAHCELLKILVKGMNIECSD